MRYFFPAVVCVVAVFLAIMMMPAQEVSAGGFHWEGGAPMQNQDGDWVIYAEFKNPDGGVEDTVSTGTTDRKGKSRRASRKLAESLNEGGSAFKWDPACEGAHFDC
ncbi:MAG: hypothetical protein SGI88_03130 [Candidatus Hydrogenedentes bacterium]|nr:hypothetical protein [Candidatus Hydrogenedentota bacterium]